MVNFSQMLHHVSLRMILFFFFFFNIYVFVCLFLSTLGLPCCAGLISSFVAAEATLSMWYAGFSLRCLLRL